MSSTRYYEFLFDKLNKTFWIQNLLVEQKIYICSHRIFCLISAIKRKFTNHKSKLQNNVVILVIMVAHSYF